MAYLVIHSPGKAPYRQPIETASAVLGRALGVDVWVDDPRLSRRHCKLMRENGRWLLEDLKSSNGTVVGEKRIEHHALRDGEAFVVGDTRVVFHADVYVAHRPTDPSEASRAQQMTETNADSTLVGRPTIEHHKRRATPAPAPQGDPSGMRPMPRPAPRPS